MKKHTIILFMGLLTCSIGYSQEECRRVFREEHTTWSFPGRELKALVSIPPGDGPFPVVMAIHGGGFNQGNRSWFDSIMHQHFIDLEIAFICVEYRLVKDGGKHPEAIRDCMHNLHWIKDNALDLKIDPSRIAVMGSSAGSYLAMMVGLTCHDTLYQADYGPYQGKSSSVNAIISSAAMYDWSAIKNGDLYIKGFREDMKASPVYLAPFNKTRAYLLLGGDNDLEWSPSKSAATMQRRLTNAGVHSELYLMEETDHPALYKMEDKYVKWAFEKIDPFLEKYLR
ncbi:alpha/beta hydrolase [Bacteroidota bacterium]